MAFTAFRFVFYYYTTKRHSKQIPQAKFTKD